MPDVSAETPETWGHMTPDHQKNWKSVVLVDDHGGAVFVKNEIGLNDAQFHIPWQR